MHFQIGPAVIPVNIPTPQALMTALDQRLRARQGFALATINLDHIVKLHRLPDYHSAYAKHEMICADGNPIVWLSRLARRPVGLVQGSDMIRPMLTVAARAGRSVAMVGSTEETLAASAEQLMRDIPGLVVVMRHAPQMDFVFTVCDTAAAEECPPWPGQPITGHWGLPDPVKAVGTDAEKALVFAQTYAALRRRIAAFVELPFDSLSRMSLQSRVDAIGTDTETKA